MSVDKNKDRGDAGETLQSADSVSKSGRADGRVPLGSTKKRPGDPGMGTARPTDFSSHNIILPRSQLNTAKVTDAARLRQAPERNPQVRSGSAEVPRPVLKDIPIAKTEPRPDSTAAVGWGIAKNSRRRSEGALAALGQPSQGQTPAQQDRRSRKRDAALEEQWDYDSPLPFRRAEEPPRRSRVVQLLRQIGNSRVLQGVVLTTLMLFLVSSLDVPWRPWFSSQLGAMKERFATVLDTVSRPIEDRAAFFIADNFQSETDQWLSRESGSLARDSTGRVASGNMFLRQDTLKFANYRIDFEAKIERGAVGWVVRAGDFDNYYGFKLIESASRSQPVFHLERFTQAAGAKLGGGEPVRMELPPDIARSGGYNRISVRVRGDHITTLVNGFGVDYWQDKYFNSGGVGLFADAGESALVNRLTVAGNDDSWGLFLYGTIKTLRSVQDRLPSNAAIVLVPSPLMAATAGPYPYPIRLSSAGR
jgi:hypothetical protein